MEFCSNKLVFDTFEYKFKLGESISDVGYATYSMLFSNCQQKFTALSTKRLGKYYREHTKSLQNDGTQIPFYIISEIKKKDYCNLCCRR